jgi:hypothetical protein
MTTSTKLHIGSVDAAGIPTGGSMARAIYDALATLVPLRADEDPTGRSKLAVAVAHGVLTHLQAQSEALYVTLQESQGPVDHIVSVNVG